jgi:hypothetical protein
MTPERLAEIRQASTGISELLDVRKALEELFAHIEAQNNKIEQLEKDNAMGIIERTERAVRNATLEEVALWADSLHPYETRNGISFAQKVRQMKEGE